MEPTVSISKLATESKSKSKVKPNRLEMKPLLLPKELLPTPPQKEPQSPSNGTLTRPVSTPVVPICQPHHPSQRPSSDLCNNNSQLPLKHLGTEENKSTSEE
uniref:Uncharacterized protein n=1 Tax=Cacopsylla melanoneura TaxID=428564 RepID=A0A8D8XNQ2_9HEMI